MATPVPPDTEAPHYSLSWGGDESTLIIFRINTITWSFLNVSAVHHILTITQKSVWHTGNRASKVRKTILELSPHSSDDLYHKSWIIGSLIISIHIHQEGPQSLSSHPLVSVVLQKLIFSLGDEFQIRFFLWWRYNVNRKGTYIQRQV